MTSFVCYVNLLIIFATQQKYHFSFMIPRSPFLSKQKQIKITFDLQKIAYIFVDLKNLVERQHWQFMMLKHFAEKMQSAMMLQCLLSREQQPQPPPPPPPPSRASDRTFKPIRRVESQGSHKIKYAPYPIHLQPNPHHHQQQQQQQQQPRQQQQQQQPQVTTAWMAPTIDTISLEVAEDDHQQLIHYDHNFGSGCFSTNA